MDAILKCLITFFLKHLAFGKERTPLYSLVPNISSCMRKSRAGAGPGDSEQSRQLLRNRVPKDTVEPLI